MFETFRQTGSAMRVVHHFKTEGVLRPRRITKGVRAGELLFGFLEHTRVLGILHNPRYTGAFVCGRIRERKVTLEDSLATGVSSRKNGRCSSPTCIRDTSPGKSLKPIRQNYSPMPTAILRTGAKSPPREGAS